MVATLKLFTIRGNYKGSFQNGKQLRPAGFPVGLKKVNLTLA
jgi:hypothetical protein